MSKTISIDTRIEVLRIKLNKFCVEFGFHDKRTLEVDAEIHELILEKQREMM